MKFDVIRKMFSKGREMEEKKAFPFQSSTVIETPESLFGRLEKLQKLCGYAEGLHQVQIIGARRFGKTCLAKSFVTLEKRNKKRNVNPVFVDIYSDEISGTANVYRYLSALVISNLLNDEFISDNTLNIFGYLVTPHADWTKVFEQLTNIENGHARFFFDEIVEQSNIKTGQTLLLIFDEYEKSTEAFDNVNGFRHLRKLSEKSSLKFWIVGATPWETLILADDKADYRASHVFNGVQHELYVCPLELEDFKKMWNNECSLMPEDSTRQSLESICDKVFVSSGGVPCFAKEIGARTYIEGKYPGYDCLSKHFLEIEKMLTNDEMNCLRELLYAPKEYDSSEIPQSINSLKNYGLISKNEHNKYTISIRFFSDYLHAKLLDKQLAVPDNLKIDGIVEKIDETIIRINEKWKTLSGTNMFDRANDTGRLFRNLRKACDCRDKACTFINSIYLIYWEGAKESKGGDKIPDSFKETMFRKAMDRIRHVLGLSHQQDKLQVFDNQIDKPTALKEIWGETIEPQTPNDWLFFQECMLIRFLQELTDIYDSIRNVSTAKAVPVSRSFDNSKKVSGIFQKGNFGKNDYIRQDDRYGCKQEVRSIRAGEILKDGDHVEYNLCWEPNHNDPSLKFYFAEDVHLKRK